jgi:hypothetical protein
MLLLKVLRQVMPAVQPMVRKVEVRMKAWTKPASDSLIGGTAADLVKSKPELIAENAFLRQQLIVVTRHAKQPQLTPKDRGLLVLPTSRCGSGKTRC